jgi:hypothetical protein
MSLEGSESSPIRRRADLRARLDPGKADGHPREGQVPGKLEIAPGRGWRASFEGNLSEHPVSEVRKMQPFCLSTMRT